MRARAARPPSPRGFGLANLLILVLAALLAFACGGAHGEDFTQSTPALSNHWRPFPDFPSHPLPTWRKLGRIEAESSVVPAVGQSDNDRRYVDWSGSAPGYLLGGDQIDGERGLPLPGGVYRFVFGIGRGNEPPHLEGTPIVRLEVWDTTTNQLLRDETLAVSDFEHADQIYRRSLLFSMTGREHHRVEPRVYWLGSVDADLDYVDLEQSASHPTAQLGPKLSLLDQIVQERFLDPMPGTDVPALVVSRQNGRASGADGGNRGDSATWTGYYAAAQAFRLRADPGSAEALERMERALRALHVLHETTGEPGLIARYANTKGEWAYEDPCEHKWRAGWLRLDPNGQPLCSVSQMTCEQGSKRKIPSCPGGQPRYEEISSTITSKDVISGFMFGVGAAFELIRDPALKLAIRDDVSEIARAFIDNGFSVVKQAGSIAPESRTVLLPFFSANDKERRAAITEKLETLDHGLLHKVALGYLAHKAVIGEVNRLLGTDAVLRATFAVYLEPIGCGVSDFLLPPVPTNILPASGDALLDAVEDENVDRVMALLPNFVTELRASTLVLTQFLRSAAASIRGAEKCLFLKKTAKRYHNLSLEIDRVSPILHGLIMKVPQQLTDLSALKWDASSAILAAQILGVARLVSPQRFESEYYDYLLGGGMSLLGTAETWAEVDETFNATISGDAGADKARSDTNHLSRSALFNLTRLEPRQEIRSRWAAVFDRASRPTLDETNPLYDAFQAARAADLPRLGQVDFGLLGWTLAQVPPVRSGYTRARWEELAPDVRVLGGDALKWDGTKAKSRLRDPVPVGIRVGHDMFFPQRNARAAGFDDEAASNHYPSVDALLAYYIARSAGFGGAVPPTAAAPHILPAQAIRSTGTNSLTKAGNLLSDCKSSSGILRTPSRIGALPGPYGRRNVSLGRTVLAEGYGEVVAWLRDNRGKNVFRKLQTEGNWDLQVDVQPHGISWNAEVCTSGVTEAIELRFYANILVPARTSNSGDWTGSFCPTQAVVAHDQGEDLASGLNAKEKPFGFWLPVPPGAPPLDGPFGHRELGRDGFEDDQVLVRPTGVYRGVIHFSMDRYPEGIQVNGRIRRERHFKGGANLNVHAELRSTPARELQMGLSASKLSWTLSEGEEGDAQALEVLAATHNCDPIGSPIEVEVATDDGPWAWLSQQTPSLPTTLRLRASAMNLQARAAPYRGHLVVSSPWTQVKRRTVDLELTVTPRVCAPGFTATRFGCIDKNECLARNGGCHSLAQCTNLAGDRACSQCATGYSGAGENGCSDVDECAIGNGGCDPLSSCTNTVGGRSCGPCPAGYVGNGETGCVEVDECQTNHGGCDPLSNCINLAGSHACGDCPEGYQGTGASKCVDVDECQVEHGDCDALRECINLPGTSACGPCPSGFLADASGTCVDVDECATSHGGCDPLTQCVNTPGSHSCGVCPLGYAGDGSTECRDLDECSTNHGGCSPLVACSNLPGGFQCGTCPAGYVDSLNDACADLDECATGNGGCDPLTTCTNTPGSRTCSNCPTGYLGTGATGCVDHNECAVDNGGCDALTRCNNLPGGRSCSACPAGYIGTGESGCVDIDECAANNGSCDPLVSCTNIAGSRLCGPCPTGYSGTGQDGCIDIDECASNHGNCDPLTTCNNVPGGRVCGACPVGYSGSGASGCADIDECAVANGGCDPLTSCTNSVGGRSCGACPTGYSGSGENGCVDVDECASNNGGCDPLAACTNQPGSHACGPCPPGYLGDGESGCIDIDECASNNGDCEPRLSCVNTPGAHGCAPRFQALGYLPGATNQYAEVYGMSGDGTTVVGQAINASGAREAWVWTEEDGIRGLGYLPTGVPASSRTSTANAATPDGSVVVGTSIDQNGGSTAFAWTPSTGMRAVQLPANHFASRGSDVDASGTVIAGDAILQTPSLNYVAAIWSPSPTILPLAPGISRGAQQQAHAVSRDGKVFAVWAQTGSETGKTFLWTASSGYQDISGSTTFGATRMSADGKVLVGSCPNACRWRADTGIIQLASGPGGWSQALATNFNGSLTVGIGGAVALIWDDNPGVRVLQTVLEEAGADLTGWKLWNAAGISDDGKTIAGGGYSPDGHFQGWRVQLP